MLLMLYLYYAIGGLFRHHFPQLDITSYQHTFLFNNYRIKSRPWGESLQWSMSTSLMLPAEIGEPVGLLFCISLAFYIGFGSCV